MSDITTLAAKLKVAAIKVGAEKWVVKKISGDNYVIRSGSYKREQGYFTYSAVAEIDDKNDRDFIALANPANVRALVEALEAAEESVRTLESRNRRLEGIIDAAESRIQQLEGVIKEQDQRLISYAAIATKNATAASEARTLTVNLPDGYKPHVQKGGAQGTSYRAVMSGKGPWIHRDILIETFAAAGIKLQIEE